MLSHVVSDLYESYVNEVLKPQIGQSGAQEKPEGGEQKTDSAGGTSVKRIRQAVYDIRYRARREDIPLETAFTQYMSHTSMNSLERKAVREKLGLVSGGGSSIKEELRGHEDKKFKVRVTDKQSGKTYVRSATRKKIQQLRSNPFISSVEMTKYGKGYEGEEKKGEQTSSVTSGKGLNPGAGEKYENKYGKGGKNTLGDLDKDGTKEPDKHEYAGVKDNAIKKAIANKKKKTVKEEYSDWRSNFDIFEASVDDNIESSNAKKIKEKNIENKVIINPDLKETFKTLGGQLIEAVELNEEFVNNVIHSATEYFFEQGLNENGIDILIEEIGNDEFSEWVFEISEERAAKKRKGGKSYDEIKAEIDAKEKVKQKLAAAKKEKKVETAKAAQKPTPEKTPASKTKKGILDRVAGAVLSGVERHQQATAAASQAIKAGVQRHRQATQTASRLAKETGKTAAKVGKVAAHVGSHAASTVEKAAKGAKKVITKEEAKNPYAIGTAAAMKLTGDKPPLKKSTITKAHKIAKKIKAQEEVENFKEAISTVTATPDSKVSSVQKDTEQKQTKNIRQKLEKIMSAKREAIRSGVTNVNV